MVKRHLLAISITLITLLAFSGTALLAQSETATVVPPPTFTDGRINDIVGLGGLAIYCVDQNGNTHVSSFDNGAITVWGIGDQKYINLTAAQLRGSEEISQTPSVMEAQMTEDASDDAANRDDDRRIGHHDGGSHPDGNVEEPVLLARATTPTGEIGFFSFGGDMFALQGHDDKGSFYTYTWTGCSTGKLDHSTVPTCPCLKSTATLEVSDMMTAEATTSP